MRLIYAPSLREKTDILHANCLVSYDIQILETLLSLNNGGGWQAPLCKQTPLEILYLPHKDTPQNYNKIIINSLKQYKLKQIDKIQDCNALITDNQNLALEFITNFKKPCIFALSGLVDGIFKLNELAPEHLQQLIYYAYSLEELTNAIKQIKQK